MSKNELYKDYVKRARLRYKILPQLIEENDYADVIRISQEIVELVEKAVLLKIGINPPKWHDVIDIIIENKEKIPDKIYSEILDLRKSAKWLRSQREISFYGDVDFIPFNEYSSDDAQRAMEVAKRFLMIIENEW